MPGYEGFSCGVVWRSSGQSSEGERELVVVFDFELSVCKKMIPFRRTSVPDQVWLQGYM